MRILSAQTFSASLLHVFAFHIFNIFENLSVRGLSLSSFLLNIGLFDTVMIDSLHVTILAFSI